MRKTRIAKTLLSAAVVTAALAAFGTTAWADGCAENPCSHVAAIGQTHYSTLNDAIGAVPENDGSPTTIDVLADVTGGVILNGNKNVIINMNGYNYDVKKPVGSLGTETNGMQLIHGCKVVINGKSKTDSQKRSVFKSTSDQWMGFLIKNYCDLTLNDIDFDSSKVGAQCCTINNCGGKLTLNNCDISNVPKGSYSIATGNYSSDSETIINSGIYDSIVNEGTFWDGGGGSATDSVVDTKIYGGTINFMGEWDYGAPDLDWSFFVKKGVSGEVSGAVAAIETNEGKYYYSSLSKAVKLA